MKNLFLFLLFSFGLQAFGDFNGSEKQAPTFAQVQKKAPTKTKCILVFIGEEVEGEDFDENESLPDRTDSFTNVLYSTFFEAGFSTLEIVSGLGQRKWGGHGFLFLLINNLRV
jgi:hypothetical protein